MASRPGHEAAEELDEWKPAGSFGVDSELNTICLRPLSGRSFGWHCAV